MTGQAGEPIFVVGTPRSGTTLLASLLDAHPGIACGPETAFYGFARDLDRRRVLGDASWPDAAVQFVAGLVRKREGSILDAYGLTPGDVRAELTGRPHLRRSLLEAIVVPYARREGKPRWAEKSPRHLADLALIREDWPSAPIIGVLRDPRAVVASARAVPFGAQSVVGSAYAWNRQQLDAEGWFRTDSRWLHVRYEELVTDPERVLREVCAFVGEPYAESMLAAAGERRTLAAGGETWKGRVGQAIDSSRASAWQTELDADDRRRVELICAEAMALTGYPGGRAARGALRVFTPGSGPKDQPELLEPATDAELRLEPASSISALIRRRPDAVCRPAGGAGWSGSRGVDGRVGEALLVGVLLLARLRGRPVARLLAPGAAPGAASFMDRLVRRLTRPVPLAEIGSLAPGSPTA